MKQPFFTGILIALLLLLSGMSASLFAQAAVQEKIKKASKKIEKGFSKSNPDTLAQGYFDLGESFYQKGEATKAEGYYQKSRTQYEKSGDADGIAKSSRALAKVQEELNKKKDALANYNVAQKNTTITGDSSANVLNGNDISRLSAPNSVAIQQRAIQSNINVGIKNNDSTEVASSYNRMAETNLLLKRRAPALLDYSNAYKFSKNVPEQALKFNQLLTNEYLKDKNFSKAIETKKQVLKEPFVENSSQVKASEITSLAEIYIQKKEDNTAIDLLNESYALSVAHGHTLEAKKCIEKLDSIFQSTGNKEKSLELYKAFLKELPGIISKDSSLNDNRIIEETESKLKKLETEKRLKDDLIREKNIVNYWLIGSVIVLAVFIGFILLILKKLKRNNKKIALQSLRREMNPHFIFNSLNSINQFISNNNELAANQYLTKFSTLMRRVMENSKEDFVSFSKEAELLQNYLDLEKSRFSDKFDFNMHIDDALYAEEQLYIPGMLIQPHLENAIWHGLRYSGEKGFLQLSFTKKSSNIVICIEDNGIGIAESRKVKTANQQKHSGRGMTNTLERISILNELYHHKITCTIEDKQLPDHGVKVSLTVPILKSMQHED